MFTDRDVRNAQQGLRDRRNDQARAVPGRDADRQGDSHPERSFRVIGVLSRKGANMMGMDQDDIVLAPWTTIKYRVSRQHPDQLPTRASRGSGGFDRDTVNTLNNLYPGRHGALSDVVGTQTADTPAARAVRQRRPDQRQGRLRRARFRRPSTQITDLFHERHRIRPDQPDDFNIRDMTEITKTISPGIAT